MLFLFAIQVANHIKTRSSGNLPPAMGSNWETLPPFTWRCSWLGIRILVSDSRGVYVRHHWSYYCVYSVRFPESKNNIVRDTGSVAFVWTHKFNEVFKHLAWRATVRFKPVLRLLTWECTFQILSDQISLWLMDNLQRRVGHSSTGTLGQNIEWTNEGA